MKTKDIFNKYKDRYSDAFFKLNGTLPSLQLNNSWIWVNGDSVRADKFRDMTIILESRILKHRPPKVTELNVK